MQICLDRTVPSKVTAVYIFRLGGRGSKPPLFICHLNVFPSDKNCFQDLSLQTATPDSESILTQYVQFGVSVDHLIKSFASLYVSNRRVWDSAPCLIFLYECFSLGLKLFYRTLPSNWFLSSNFLHWLETTGAKYLSTPRNFLWKCTISATICGFMRNMYINITCSSLFWIPA